MGATHSVEATGIRSSIKRLAQRSIEFSSSRGREVGTLVVVGDMAEAVTKVAKKQSSEIRAKVLKSPMTRETSVVGRAKVGVGVKVDRVLISSSEKVNRGIGSISTSIQKATEAVRKQA